MRVLFEQYPLVVIAVVRGKKNFLCISVWITGLEVLVYERRISEVIQNFDSSYWCFFSSVT